MGRQDEQPPRHRMSITLTTELYDGTTTALTVELPANWIAAAYWAPGDREAEHRLMAAAAYLHKTWRESLPPEPTTTTERTT